MKKILLIIAIVLCVAVAGTAFAVQYKSATSKTGTVSADSYLKLSLGTSADNASIELSASAPTAYMVDCVISKSTNAGTADLIVEVNEDVDGKDLDNVSIGIYNDIAGLEPVAGVVTTGSIGDATRTFTVSGLTTDGVYYVLFSVPSNIEDDDLEATGGSMTVTLQAHTAA